MDGARSRPDSNGEFSRTMKGTNPVGRGTLALVVAVTLLVGIVGGSTAGYYLSLTLGGSGTPGGGVEITFEIRAKLSGYEGVGGSIDGARNPTLNLNKGDRVTIILIGGEAMTHDLLVEGYNMRADYVMAVGQSSRVVFDATQEGTFAYYCTVPGHRAAGMEGRLVVGSGSGGNGGRNLPPIGPVQPRDVVNISRHPTDLPGALNRSASGEVHLFLDAREVTSWLERTPTANATFTYWTFNGTVPGPFFRVRVGDTVVVHFANNATSTMAHSVDFHAVTGPGGGAVSTQTAPGRESTFTFRPLNPGLFVYHCASPHIPSHIAMGMYGLILVEPAAGLPYFDGAGRPIKEFYVMQGDIYTRWPTHTSGHQEFDDLALLDENPTYVVFNGRYQALTGDYALRANVNDTVRIFFGVGGPNLISSFHVIGEIFDRVYLMGDVQSAPQLGIQTTLAVPGGATIVEFRVEVGSLTGTTYLLVDHALSRAIDKGAVGHLVVTGTPDPTVYDGPTGGSGP